METIPWRENGNDKGKRVGILCQHFYPELISTGMHMTELATALRKEGWDLWVYCGQPSIRIEGGNPRVPAEMEYEGVRILRVAAFGRHRKGLLGRFAYGCTYLASVGWAVFRDAQALDVLLVTTNPSILGLVGRAVSFCRGLPYVVIVYDVYPDVAVRLGLFRPRSPFVWLWERLMRAMLRGAAAIVVIGRDMAELVSTKLRGAAPPPMHLIPNWSDEETVRPIDHDDNPFRRRHVPEGYFVVQYSGNMAMTHNLEPLLEAARLLAGQRVFFQFIGDGTKRKKLQALCESWDLRNVQFLPYQDRSALSEVLSAADLSAVCLGVEYTGVSVPSKTYGIMASGRPILGFLAEDSEIGQTILEKECGVVLENPTGEQVARAIMSLRQNPDVLRRWGQNSYRAFRECYTLSRAAKRYSEVLEGLTHAPEALSRAKGR